jgi:hypothetical protein
MREVAVLTPELWVFFTRHGFRPSFSISRPKPRVHPKSQALGHDDIADLEKQSGDPELVWACLHVLKSSQKRRGCKTALKLAAIQVRALKQIKRKLGKEILPKLDKFTGIRTVIIADIEVCIQHLKSYVASVEKHHNAFQKSNPHDDALIVLIDSLRKGRRMPRGTYTTIAGALDILGREVDPEALRVRYERIRKTPQAIILSRALSPST